MTYYDDDFDFKVTPTELEEILEKCFRFKEPIMVVGPPGVGKSEIPEQITERLGHKFLVMYPAISEPVDFRGMPVYIRDKNTAEFVPFGDLNKLIEANEPTVVLVDDFGQANISIQAATMHLFRARRIGNQKISDHITFVVCTNDQTHMAGVAGVLEPVKSRMLSIVHLKTDVDAWVKWAINFGIRPEVIGFIRLRNEMLSDFQPNMGFENTPSPRGNEKVSKVLEMDYDRKTEIKVIKGTCGKGYAVEFDGFRRIFDKIEDPRKILTDPDSVMIPTTPDGSLEISTAWAYCTALTYLAKPKHMDNIVRFAERLPIELQVKLLQFDCKAADVANHETKAFTDWALKNQDVYKYAA